MFYWNKILYTLYLYICDKSSILFKKDSIFDKGKANKGLLLKI